MMLKTPGFAKQEVMGLEGSMPGPGLCVLHMKALDTVVDGRPQE